MRLRQIALVAHDLEATSAQLGALLGIEYGYHDPGIIKFGLDNWVAAIGDTFLEVVSPVQENTTAGRYLEKRGGDGGYMVILQVEDLERAQQRIEAAGARVVWQANGRAEDGSGERTDGLHVHPRDCGGAILSLDQATPPAAWVWAGPEWRQHDSRFLSQILAVELQSSDPENMAKQWGRLLAQKYRNGAAPDGRPAWILELEDSANLSAGRRSGSVRFVHAEDGRGDGVCAFDVGVKDDAAAGAAARRSGLQPAAGNLDVVEAAGVRIFLQSV